MNPIEKKIREAGGTILSEPLLDEKGNLNPSCVRQIEEHFPDVRAERMVLNFAKAILHGDEVHRAWLREAAEAFIDGKPIPAPRAKTPSQGVEDSQLLDWLEGVYLESEWKSIFYNSVSQKLTLRDAIRAARQKEK